MVHRGYWAVNYLSKCNTDADAAAIQGTNDCILLSFDNQIFTHSEEIVEYEYLIYVKDVNIYTIS